MKIVEIQGSLDMHLQVYLHLAEGQTQNFPWRISNAVCWQDLLLEEIVEATVASPGLTQRYNGCMLDHKDRLSSGKEKLSQSMPSEVFPSWVCFLGSQEFFLGLFFCCLLTL